MSIATSCLKWITRPLLTANFVVVLVSIVLSIGALEVALRLYPSLIAVAVLDRMTPSLRTEIAARLNLSTKGTRYVFESSSRTDGGPDIYMYYPNSTVIIPVDSVDELYGGIGEARIDQNGFCNPPAAAARERHDIVLIGDSMTFCSAISPEQTSSAMLEDVSGYRAYNLGLPGIGVYEYVELLAKFGLPTRPRVVVMMIAVGNDLRDAERYFKFREFGESREDNSGVKALSWSYALSFIVAAVEQQIRQIRFFADVDFRYTVQVGSEKVEMNVYNKDRDEVRNAYRIVAGELSMTLLEPALNRFLELADAHGFTPQIAFVPSAFVPYESTVAFADPELGQVVMEASEIMRMWLLEYCESHGLKFIDLNVALRESAESGVLTHFPANRHLTPLGNRVVAEAIANEMPVQEGN